MRRGRSIAIVGPGRLGAALAQGLFGEGYEIREIVAREPLSSRARAITRRVRSRLTSISGARLDADVVWICTPDDAISSVAKALATVGEWKNKIALHSSAALSSRELQPLKARGASVGSAHPMMTFAAGAQVEWRDVALALEGDRAAVAFAGQFAKKLGMHAFHLRQENKILYHVLGSFSSPLLIALLRAAEDVAGAAGIKRNQAREIIGPILEQTIRNYRTSGADLAFTGPMARGDVAVVARHIEALKRVPLGAAIYRELAKIAAERLPAADRDGLRKLLR